jgi:hypothetical protein
MNAFGTGEAVARVRRATRSGATVFAELAAAPPLLVVLPRLPAPWQRNRRC